MNIFNKKHILILGVKHSITYFDSPSREDGAMGRSDETRASIRICNDMPKDVQEQTIMHEVTHLLSSNLSLGLNEKQVNALSAGLYSVIKENK